jgi:amino acid transporter
VPIETDLDGRILLLSTLCLPMLIQNLPPTYSPRVAFLYGWVLLLVTQSGGMAAVAVTFARFLGELLALPLSEAVVAVLALAALTAVNCLGVRAGNDVQALLMVLKTVAILGLVATGLAVFGGERVRLVPLVDRPLSLDLVAGFGAAGVVPVPAIALQGLVAAVIAASGRYEQILNYVVSVDFIAMGLTGAALFVFRRRGEEGSFRAPGHPWTTAFFVLSCWAVVAATIHRYPRDSVIGLTILALGLPVYWLWSARRTAPEPGAKGEPV